MTTTTATRANPYVGPRSFSTGETLYGRDREAQKLLNLLIAERIVLLYSPSGAGKTSLMQAALIPRLRDEGFTVLPVARVGLEPPAATAPAPADTRDDPLLRVLLGLETPVVSSSWSAVGSRVASDARPRTMGNGQPATGTAQPPNRYVLSVLLALEEAAPADRQLPLEQLAQMTLADYLDQHADSAAATDGVVLILDQFEEILTVDPANTDAKHAFFAQLGAALRDRRRWALFAMREDYLAPLDPYLRHIPTRLNTTFRLDLLDAQGARQAMQQPARRAGVMFADAAANALIDDLRRVQVQLPDGTIVEELGPYVEPVQLQVVCYRLWERLPTDDLEIGSEDVAEVGDVDSALTAYYAERVAAIAQATGTNERAIRDWFDTQLITEQGLRGQVLQGGEQSAGLPNRAIWPLIDAHLVRGEKRRGATWFELAHDRLIEPVRKNNAAWSAANLSSLQRQATLWERQDRPEGLLLRDAELAEAVGWAAEHPDQVTATEREFLAECRKAQELAERARRTNRQIRILAVAASVAFVIALGLAAVAFWLKNQAEQQKQITFTGQLVASSAAARERAPQQALLLAVEAISSTHGLAATLPAAEAALHRALATAGGMVLHRPQASEIGMFLSADGRYLVTVDIDALKRESGTIRRWDLSSPDARPVEVPNHGQLPAALSAGGHYLITPAIGTAPSARWDLAATPPVSVTLPTPANPLAISADGRYIAVLTQSYAELQRWDLAATPPISVSLPLAGARAGFWKAALSADGRYVVSGSSDGRLLRWDLAGTRPVSVTLASSADAQAINALALSADGRYVIGGSSNGTVRRWDMAGDMPDPIVLAGNEDMVTALAISADGRYMLSGGIDNTVRRWDMQHLAAVPLVLRGQDTPLLAVALSSDQPAALGVSGDGTVRRWDLAAPTADPLVLPGQAGLIGEGAFSQDSSYLVTANRMSGTRGSTVSRWDPTNPTTPTDVLDTPPDGISVGSISIDGRYLIGWPMQGETHYWRWDLSNPKAVPVVMGEAFAFLHAQMYSSDGMYALGIDNNQRVELWNWSQPLTRTAVLGGPADASDTQFNLGQQYIVGVGSDGAVRRWAVATPAAGPAILSGPGTFSRKDTSFSPDGRYLIAWGNDGIARWWDTHAPAGPPRLLSDPDLNGASWQKVLSPDGGRLATVAAADGKTIRLWNIGGGPPVTLHGQEGSVGPIEFSPNNHYLITGGGFKDVQMTATDFVVRVWDLSHPTADPIVLPGHREAVFGIRFSPDERYLISGDGGDTALVWRMQRNELIALACRVAGRNMTWDEWRAAMGENEPYHKTCPSLPIHPSFVESGRELAREGQASGAQKRFQEALRLEPGLNLDPQAEAQRIFALGAAQRDKERGLVLVAQGAIEQATEAFQSALRLDREIAIPANTWYDLCWAGVMHKQAKAVLEACDQAVELEGDGTYSFRYHRARSLARALTGDLKGAAEDMQVFVTWLQEQSVPATTVAKYNQWLTALMAGDQPFDEPTLKELESDKTIP